MLYNRNKSHIVDMSLHSDTSYQISVQGPSCWWSYGSWIYNYLCNQCISPLTLWVRISIRVRCTTLSDKVSDLWQVGFFYRVLRFPPIINWPPRYSWNIVESGVKYHRINNQMPWILFLLHSANVQPYCHSINKVHFKYSVNFKSSNGRWGTFQQLCWMFNLS